MRNSWWIASHKRPCWVTCLPWLSSRERARESGNLREAQRWYQSAYESGDSDSYFQLGRVLAHSGQQDQARKIFTDLSQQGDKRAAYELYALAERDGDDTAARAWLALGAKDGDNDCRFILAGQYLDQGQESEAEQLFSCCRRFRTSALDGSTRAVPLGE